MVSNSRINIAKEWSVRRLSQDISENAAQKNPDTEDKSKSFQIQLTGSLESRRERMENRNFSKK